MATEAKRTRLDVGKLPPEGGGGSGTQGADELSFSGGPAAPISAIHRNDSYFKQQYLDTTWQDNFRNRILPSSSDGTKFIFQLPKMDGTLHQYINYMLLFLRVKIVDKDGKVPENQLTIAPVNPAGQAVVGRVRMTANGTAIMDTAQHAYPITSYMGQLLNNGRSRKRGIMQREGYYEDIYRPEQGPFGSEWDDFHANSGWDKRRRLFGIQNKDAAVFQFKDDHYAHFNIPIHTEFRDTLPMVSRVGVTVEITLSEPGFYLQCSRENWAKCKQKKYRYQVDYCHLKVPVRDMSPGPSLDLEKKLLKVPAEFNNVRMDVSKFLIPQGVKSFNTDQIKSFAVCPQRIAFMMIPDYLIEDDYGPSAFRSCPYVDEKWKVTKVGTAETYTPPDIKKRVYLSDAVLTINNQSLEDINPIDHRMLQDEFFNILHNHLGLDNGDRGISIEREDFINGKFIMLFDLTKSGRGYLGGGVRQEVKQGSVKIALRFTDALPCNVYLFALAEYRSKVKVTAGRTVYYQYID